MTLQPGTRLGHYEITSLLGTGGMGEVYRAKDNKLGRDVAVKVLPEAFADNKERLARFEREARLLASLNHPNIAAIHELEESDGVHFLALEYVPGETLAERIKRGPIPIDETLPLFKQIAEGLEAAHENGVVHRDLKPANIKVTPEGKVKVLDFGLAKAMAGETPVQGLSESPTITREHTEAGVLLGTAPYMSPEQARGKPVDKRTDIWAFGCCLYEALTGKTAFLGDTVTDTIAKIVEREPDWEALPATTPVLLRDLLRRCLNKDSNHRLHDIADARIELEETLNDATSQTVGIAADAKGGRGAIPLVLATALIASAATAVAFWIFARPEAPAQKHIARTVIPLSPGAALSGGNSMSISPDGKYVAYAARLGNVRRLYLRAINELEGKPIDGTERATTPFFSPDSQWLGFKAGRKLMKVAVSGGAPLAVGEVSGNSIGACWTSEKEIVFNTTSGGGLSRISADGGEPEILTTSDQDRREKTHRHPRPLPGGKALLFTLGTADIDSYDDASIAVLSLETGDYHVVIEGGFNARYSTTGHIVYARAGSLLAVPFDLDELRVKGSPVPVLQGVLMRPITGGSWFSISRDGNLLYAAGRSWREENRVVWVDREGRTEPLIETPHAFSDVRVSPDGHFLGLQIGAANSNISVYDIARATLTRLTFGYDNFLPVWTRDGHRLTFTSTRTVPRNVFWQAADGSGDAEQLTTGKKHHGLDWSPDGRKLAVLEENLDTGLDIVVLSLDEGRTLQPFLQTRFREWSPTFSPNGQWIAYLSDESGQSEVYVRRFPSAEGKRQVSTGGGDCPEWNPSGQELFYTNGNKMMVVDVETEGELTLGVPRVLFEKFAVRPLYDVTPDGQRFVMIERGELPPAPSQMILVQNWGEELKRLVPTN